MQTQPKTLLLGTTKDLENLDGLSGRETVMPCRTFEQLSNAELAEIAPDVVVSLFVCGSLDCLEISQRLVNAGFTGRYYVLAPELPDPQIIINEITQSCPGIDIHVVTNPPSI